MTKISKSPVGFRGVTRLLAKAIDLPSGETDASPSKAELVVSWTGCPTGFPLASTSCAQRSEPLVSARLLV